MKAKTSVAIGAVVGGLLLVGVAVALTSPKKQEPPKLARTATPSQPLRWQGKNVLILSDSLGMAPYTPYGYLGSLYRNQGANVTIDAKSGRSASNFFTREDGDSILYKHSNAGYDLVLIALGTNDIAYGINGSDFKKLLLIYNYFANKGIPTIFIGPPAFSKLAIASGGANLGEKVGDYTKALDANIPNFLNSIPLSSDLVGLEHKIHINEKEPMPVPGRIKDYIHFGKEGAKRYAERIYAALNP